MTCLKDCFRKNSSYISYVLFSFW